ncbi:PREDICTED: high affinity copper uptake protein 1 isoform X2 [Nicrophorus vespilloides]|uniref:Copper transport protein n=1 Tax=Nicrophorus vespilloides TaxID=110193 RepID=A0ABM1MNT6_NICVS|nr:PREDICTED: high affinity copper uptake protein 1 isoform X2 [Nicrophorus vespilloides]
MNHSMHHMGHDMAGHHGSSGHDMAGHGMAGHDMAGHNMTPKEGMGHEMAMWFHVGYTETILFKPWHISTIGGLIGSMIGIFFLAALYEGLKYYREYLFWKTYNALQYRAVTLPQSKEVALEDNKIVQPTMWSKMHFFQTLLHIVQMIVSYFLMLIFMTYNVWLCLAVVLGSAVGYFLFGWKKSVIVDVTEHCH